MSVLQTSERASSLGSQSCRGAGEHWQCACTHLWDILRVPEQPPKCLCAMREAMHLPSITLGWLLWTKGRSTPKWGESKARGTAVEEEMIRKGMHALYPCADTLERTQSPHNPSNFGSQCQQGWT